MSDLTNLSVSISKGNIKMGQITSVSLPPLKTCSADACKTCAKEHCYALKIYKLRKTVRDAYDRNFNILKSDSEKYWREIEAAIMMLTTFRFHVSGDIVDETYFENMVFISERNKHCEIIAFTKKFDIVNKWLTTHQFSLPKNLHIIYSAWRGLQMSNPFLMPECHILYKTGECTAPEDKACFICNGNCSDCFAEHKHCFNLRRGEAVLIKEH